MHGVPSRGASGAGDAQVPRSSKQSQGPIVHLPLTGAADMLLFAFCFGRTEIWTNWIVATVLHRYRTNEWIR